MTRFRILLSVETSHGFGRSIIDGATRYIVEQNGEIEFEQPRLFESVPDWLRSWKGHGLLVRTDRLPIRRFLSRCGIPTVQLYCTDSPPGYDVGTDESKLGEMAVDFFLKQGHRHFASLSLKNVHWANIREQGFLDALHRRGFHGESCRCPIHFTRPLALWNERDCRRIAAWLKRLPKPVALFSLKDVFSRRIIELCKEIEINVPGQIAVLGVDNDDWLCRHHVPTLSSIDQDGYRIGYEGAALLYRKIRAEPCLMRPILIPPVEVVSRGSTDSLVVDDRQLVEVLRFLRQHDLKTLSIDDVVRHSGFSRRTIERRFRKHFGRTLGQEINHLRLESAALLLRETRLSIGSISRRCGFGTHGYFIDAFQRFFHLTPSEYRRRFFTSK